jgi:hypothetical protein
MIQKNLRELLPGAPQNPRLVVSAIRKARHKCMESHPGFEHFGNSIYFKMSVYRAEEPTKKTYLWVEGVSAIGG